MPVVWELSEVRAWLVCEGVIVDSVPRCNGSGFYKSGVPCLEHPYSAYSPDIELASTVFKNWPCERLTA